MVAAIQTDKWIVRFRPTAKPAVRLFCFSYAGGGASSFHGWAGQLQPDVDLCAMQAPGRENRCAEQLIAELPPMIDRLAEAIVPYCDLPLAFFGHCLGALTAFELARRLKATGKGELVHLFVAGCRAPQLPNFEDPIRGLSETEFVNRLKGLKLTPEGVFRDPELLSLFLPVLRADFSIWETYKYSDGEPLNCAISAFGGLEDHKLTRKVLQQWRVHTRLQFSTRMLPGGHFFLHSSQRLLLRLIGEDLRRTMLGR